MTVQLFIAYLVDQFSQDRSGPDSIKIAPDVYEATATISQALSGTAQKHITAILGSERGFDNTDRSLLRNANFTLVSLGNRVLRTDSAIIATLSHIAIR